MTSTRNTVERAFELARTGGRQTVEDVRRAFKLEDYEAVEAHLAGMAIRQPLSAVLTHPPVERVERRPPIDAGNQGRSPL